MSWDLNFVVSYHFIQLDSSQRVLKSLAVIPKLCLPKSWMKSKINMNIISVMINTRRSNSRKTFMRIYELKMRWRQAIRAQGWTLYDVFNPLPNFPNRACNFFSYLSPESKKRNGIIITNRAFQVPCVQTVAISMSSDVSGDLNDEILFFVSSSIIQSLCCHFFLFYLYWTSRVFWSWQRSRDEDLKINTSLYCLSFSVCSWD